MRISDVGRDLSGSGEMFGFTWADESPSSTVIDRGCAALDGNRQQGKADGGEPGGQGEGLGSGGSPGG